jgi:hypothetical protein
LCIIISEPEEIEKNIDEVRQMDNSEKKDIITSALSSPIKEVFTDLAQIGIDEVIEKFSKELGFLKDIPVIRWLLIGNDIRSIIQSAFFLQKFSSFIGPINETMKDNLLDDTRLTEIFSDKKTYSKIVDQIIISLDRYQTTQKAKMLSLLFIETFKKNNFTIQEYNTLIFSIENIHPHTGIECLKSFYDYENEYSATEDKEAKDEIWMKNSSIDYSPLANTGLLILPSGGMYTGSYGGAYINTLGHKFYELVVSKL